MKPKPSLTTQRAHNSEDVRAFFDQLADHYVEFHGKADCLLRYRMKIIRRLLDGVHNGVLLEIGCGTGLHLFEMSDAFESLVGTDLSPNMIRVAEKKREIHPAKQRIRLAVDSAETLATLADSSVDAVLCIGAFEHMLDKQAVLKQVYRVLNSQGAFLCLTPNGGYLWYTQLAKRLGYSTRHLSSDEFLTHKELLERVNYAGFKVKTLGYWRFIPRGDMPDWIGRLLYIIDWVGVVSGFASLRGGLYIKAIKPSA